MFDAEAKPQAQAAAPYGFLGLCLSLLPISFVCLVVTAIIGAGAGLVAVLIMGKEPFTEALQQWLADTNATLSARILFAIVVAFYLGLAITIFLAAGWRGGRQWRLVIGWQKFRLGDKVIWMVIIGGLIYSAAADAAISHGPWHPSARLTIPADPVAAASLFCLAVLLAPLTEELLFRGWLYTSLRFSFGFRAAVLATSALFALAHYENTHLYALAVFPIGVALGALRERTGSVKASMLFHAVNNLTAFALSALAGSS